MKTAFFILQFLWIGFSAQNFRVVYEVNYKPQQDSEKLKTELMALDFNPQSSESVFYNYDRQKRDSLIKIENYKDLKEIQTPYMEFSILKKDKKNAIYCNSLFGTMYCMEKKINYSWQIMQSKIESFPYSPLQKEKNKINFAKTNFSGRAWTVSYSTDIPILDGPYFFSKLPGLILVAKSDDGDYTFTAISIEKITERNNALSTKNNYSANIKESKYIKFLKNFKENPALFNMDMTNEYKDVFSYEYNGKKDDAFKNMNKYIKDRFERYNNPIDSNFPIFIVN